MDPPIIKDVGYFLRGLLVQCWRCGKWIRIDESFGPGWIGRGHIQGFYCGDAPNYCWSKTSR